MKVTIPVVTITATIILSIVLGSAPVNAQTCEPRKKTQKSTVCAEGTVHSKSTATVIYLDSNGNFLYAEEWETLKIIRPNGTKLNADCKWTGMTCNALQIGDPAIGCAECANGWCSWQQLDFNS